MEAATVQSKKAVHKGKLKKTIKNVLCRPDSIFWPEITEEQNKLLEETLDKLKLEMPHFEKLHWNELKQIPKEKRPKQPKLRRVEGLLFGISECYNAVKSNLCAAVVIEASVNPRIIVQPILETCNEMRIPIVCVSNLRIITSRNFHIPTSCLGIRNDCLSDLQNVVAEIAKSHKIPQKHNASNVIESMEATTLNQSIKNVDCEITLFPYLYRANKKSRVFVPSEEKRSLLCDMQQFKGQDFIAFKGKSNEQMQRSSYMKMIVKRISNNPNRIKTKSNKAQEKMQ